MGIARYAQLLGAMDAALPSDVAKDRGPRKNGPKGLGLGWEIGGGVVVSALGFSELDEQASFFFRFGDSGFALGLESAELGHVLFDGAADSLLVGSEKVEVAGVGEPGGALGESGVDFGEGIVGEFLVAEGEEGVFQSAGAVEAPRVLSDRLGKIELKRADRGEGFADGVAMFLECFPVLRGVDDDLAGEAVAEGVKGGTFLAFFATGAGGKLGVGAVGVELCLRSFEISLVGFRTSGSLSYRTLTKGGEMAVELRSQVIEVAGEKAGCQR